MILALWIFSSILDEASGILESTLASSILSNYTEHLVLLRNSDKLSKLHLNNTDMAGDPRNLDVSLIERWKGSGDKKVLLKEQWRMHSEVANIIDQFNSIKDETSSLLITAPLAFCNKNMVDGSKPQKEIMYGITKRAFYLDYQASEQSERNHVYSKRCKFDITDAKVNEAIFLVYFAIYLSQKRHPKICITILTVCLAQKYLILSILNEEESKRTVFTSDIHKINVNTVEGNGARARYGIFVIGNPERDNVHDRWKDFANYMKTRGLFDTHMQLRCSKHGATFSVEKGQDFDHMRNGGCRCNTK
ncbi:hypothetical protein HPULCUR_011435 [Helicostylum pulchrum]|uniref:Uncharacterized protein n=1 Tax=Helicostylum pulchrum TaxID=562976 RepID=A0ABP9YG30_9FUNG